MKYIISILLFTYTTFGQNLCNCPKLRSISSTQPDTIFSFSNGMEIGLCGYKDVDSITKNISFSEYALFVCGQDSALVYGGWFLQNSKLRQVNDTLVLEDCPYLPVGANFSELETPWTINKIYFINSKVKVEHSINRNIRKYNSQEIQTVLNEYKQIKTQRANLNDTTLALVNRLFVATISGSNLARIYFHDIPKKFTGLDAIYGEIYSDIEDKLVEWDKNNSQ